MNKESDPRGRERIYAEAMADMQTRIAHLEAKVAELTELTSTHASEIHKLRQEGIDDSGAIFGRPDFAAIAQGFGLRGARVTDVSQFKDLFEGYQAHDVAEIWDIPISDKVQTPRMRKTLKAGHGVM